MVRQPAKMLHAGASEITNRPCPHLRGMREIAGVVERRNAAANESRQMSESTDIYVQNPKLQMASPANEAKMDANSGMRAAPKSCIGRIRARKA